MKTAYLVIIFILISGFYHTYALSYDFIVAKDGSGDFSSIQSALDAVPINHNKKFIIFIKNGLYSEKIFIEKSNIALVGESPKNTKIIFSELRKNWRNNYPDDYGSAVINIEDGVRDIILSRITVYNNYGDLYGDHDHAFAIRAGSGVTKIIIDSCRIISGGGDTLSLWNTDDGMYYHSHCYFEGWVDYVCPRGYCYIENSRFFGHNLTASIWHDGSHNVDHKLVLRHCKFDGVKGFPLGRFHRDAQFYLLDCQFSDNMSDKNIYFAPSIPQRVLQWGDKRIYFYNCHRDSGDFSWFHDNLNLAPGSPAPEIIDAKWTFNYKWDPVKELTDFYILFKE